MIRILALIVILAGMASGDGRLCESRPGFAPVPLEELVEPEIVEAAGDRGRDAAEYRALQSLSLGSLRNNNQISHLGPLHGNIGSYVDLAS